VVRADASDDFEVHVAYADGDGVTVAVRGDVDLLTVPALRGVLNSSVDAGCRHLVVDLAGCRFMDASGLGVLVRVGVRLKDVEGTVALRSPRALLRRILDITHVSDFIPYEESRSANASLGPEEEVDDALADGNRRALLLSDASSTALVRSGNAAIDTALRRVTALADATIDNADGVSVTLERHGRLMTVAASNDKVLTMDRHQYETGEGPCLAAKSEGRWHYIESLDDETRWPAFVPLALGQGIHSILSSPLMTSTRPSGALNIYSSKKQAFGIHEQQLAALFADQAAEILATASTDMTHKLSNQRFAGALTERRTIHQAQGVVMARNELTADLAIGWMIRGARAAGVTLLAFATDLVAAADDDSRQNGAPWKA
jgi:anti-anti-sigma factor